MVAGLLATATPSVSQDQAWPKRAVSVVVPFAAGGTTDLFARIFTSDMQAKYGQPFVVENKPGAVLMPKLAKLLREYPDIKVEMIVDFGLRDIVAERYDAGVRGGEQVAKDMIAVRIGPDLRMAVVGAPSYFSNRPEPKKPQDLIGHNCINLRLPKHDSVYAWEFDKDGRELRVRVEGQLTFNATSQQINAALAGLGLVYAPEGMVQPYIAKGRLRRVLHDWCQLYSGYHLFYPSRRQSSAAFSLVVNALRHRQ